MTPTNDLWSSTATTAASVFAGFDQTKRRQRQPPYHNKASSAASPQRRGKAVYQFTRKHTKSTKNNPLCGICFNEWYIILCQRHAQIEWKRFWPRLVVITLLSLLNSFLATLEEYLHGPAMQQAADRIHPRPVFVLGHPRTGTTLLHSLLALDEEQFAICTTFCAGFPSCFLWFEPYGKQLFSGVMDKTRPMDNVALHFDLPQEDELATNVLSAGTSPYMPLFFMQQQEDFYPYYAFSDTATGLEALPPDEMAQARKTWTQAFLHLLAKLTVRSERLHPSSQHRLLLKSPVHTARIALLLQLFPDAQFVYVHRHPYDVFVSAAHMADTTYWYTYMNTPSNAEIQEFILSQYEILWEHYQAGKELLRPDQLVEVSFDALVTDPEGTLGTIYQQLGWTRPDSSAADADAGATSSSPLPPAMLERLHRTIHGPAPSSSEHHDQQELSTPSVASHLPLDHATPHKNYQRNQHAPLSKDLQKIVRRRWGHTFEPLGYSLDHDDDDDDGDDNDEN
eukprot:Nitzschia sp. Nitz4//scaffold118_size93875//84641//86167//NITZ4_004802-RA/size93875-processed-gene-0.46-mRNA-1//1//CDS//3329533766//8081//frame0